MIKEVLKQKTMNVTYQAGCWCSLHPSVDVHLWGHKEEADSQIETCWHERNATENLKQ